LIVTVFFTENFPHQIHLRQQIIDFSWGFVICWKWPTLICFLNNQNFLFSKIETKLSPWQSKWHILHLSIRVKINLITHGIWLLLTNAKCVILNVTDLIYFTISFLLILIKFSTCLFIFLNESSIILKFLTTNKKFQFST
jgi:hypothetical protein